MYHHITCNGPIVVNIWLRFTRLLTIYFVVLIFEVNGLDPEACACCMAKHDDINNRNRAVCVTLEHRSLAAGKQDQYATIIV